MRLFLALFFLSCSASASNQQIVGNYSPMNVQNIEVECSAKDIKSVSLVSGRPKSCIGFVRIKNITLVYDSGISQIFDFPTDIGSSDGTILTSTTFNVLPGTKCLPSLTAELIVTGEKNSKCLDQHRIQVSVER